jgi:hypothetical protein
MGFYLFGGLPSEILSESLIFPRQRSKAWRGFTEAALGKAKIILNQTG